VPNERRPARSARLSANATENASEARLEDHAEIDRLVDELLPALVAKLSATRLGEIEVREGEWKVRLRRPADGPASGRRASDRSPERASRSQPGHEGHGHARTAPEGHRSVRPTAATSSNGSGPSATPLPVGPGRPAEAVSHSSGLDQHRVIATSPAVGIYQPRAELTPGTRVRAGDRLGSVNMLGVPQEVVAPADGVVGVPFAEPGDAVEYGQELIAIELVPAFVDGADLTDGRPGGSLGGGA
jgi:biotin carboxyl carrier protein